MKNILLIFGFGYVAKALKQALNSTNWQVICTSRKNFDENNKIIPFNKLAIKKWLPKVTNILITTPPDIKYGDPVFHKFKYELSNYAQSIKWLGYISTTGVYGDHQGNWVDELTPPNPNSLNAKLRLSAEKIWCTFGEKNNITINIFRLSSIYGPQRNAIELLLRNESRSIFKENQFFSRIHIDDIVNILVLAMINQKNQFCDSNSQIKLTKNDLIIEDSETILDKSTISINSLYTLNSKIYYNLADDLPTPTWIVNEYAAKLLNIPLPKLININNSTLSSMVMEFYNSNKKVKNTKIKRELRIMLKYPTYIEGLNSIYTNIKK